MEHAWLKTLESQIRGKSAHTFLLHGNVWDDFLYGEGFLRPYELLEKTEGINRSAIQVFFNLATGVRFSKPTEMKPIFLGVIGKFNKAGMPIEDYFDINKHDISEVLKWFNELLSISWADPKDLELLRDLDNSKISKKTREHILSVRPKENEKTPFATVIFEYQATKTPPTATTGSSLLDRKVVETIRWWAQLPDIKKTHNLIILTSDSLATVSPELYQSQAVIPISIPLPDRDNMLSIINGFEKEGTFIPIQTDKGAELAKEEIARLTAGLSVVELRQIFLQAGAQKDNLTEKTLFEKKALIIQERLGDIVSVSKPPWGWEVIGGMDDRIARGMLWAEAMKSGNIAHLPKGGILLIGPPGTGKTVFAEVCAHEFDAPFLIVKNTFNQFVGASEQNMQNLIDTAWAMRPCVILFDEIEQLLLPRGGVYHGDSGVFARSSRMLMQFFSDPQIHGKVVIFALTNRPDLLDAAMKRAGRFGAKIPFLIPSKEDRISIWKALLRKEVIRHSLSGIELDVSRVIDDDTLLGKLSGMADFWNDNGKLRAGPPGEDETESNLIPLTGAEMEDVIGLSIQTFISEDDLEHIRSLSLEELSSYIKSRAHGSKTITLTGDMLIETMENYFPHEDIAAYKEMEELALLSINDERFIPKQYRARARQRRAERLRQMRSASQII